VRVLFDQGTPIPLRNHLPDHQVSTAYELGWATLTNGDLLKHAEAHGYDVLVTTDQNLHYQQNLKHRQIAIVVLSATSWPRIQCVLPAIVDAVANSKANGYADVQVPYIGES
jgi:hypothetical protein